MSAPQVQPELVLVGATLSLGGAQDAGGNPCIVLTLGTGSGLARMSLSLTDDGAAELIGRLTEARQLNADAAGGIVTPPKSLVVPQGFTGNRAARRANGHR